MIKVKRLMKPTSPVALLLGAAGLAFAMPAMAQEADEAATEEAPPAAAPAAEEPATEESQPTPAPDQPATAPPPSQPVVASPPALVPQPHRYPFAFQPRPAEPAEAQEPTTSWAPLRFAVALESRTTWLYDDGAKRMVGGKRPAAGGLSLQADVLRPRDNVAARIDLGLVTLSRSASMNGVSEQLKSNLVTLGLSLRYELLHWLAPYARVAGGLGWDKLTVADLHDRKLFGHGSVGAGLFLRSPGLHLWRGTRSPALALVGQVEGGYALASGSDFVLRSDGRSGSEKPIPTSDVPLGHVARNVPYLRVSLGLAF
jgi:hypothetical protein